MGFYRLDPSEWFRALKGMAVNHGDLQLLFVLLLSINGSSQVTKLIDWHISFPLLLYEFATFRVRHLCFSVCLVQRCIPTLSHIFQCNFGEWLGVPGSCARLNNFKLVYRLYLCGNIREPECKVLASACAYCMTGCLNCFVWTFTYAIYCSSEHWVTCCLYRVTEKVCLFHVYNTHNGSDCLYWHMLYHGYTSSTLYVYQTTPWSSTVHLIQQMIFKTLLPLQLAL